MQEIGEIAQWENNLQKIALHCARTLRGHAIMRSIASIPIYVAPIIAVRSLDAGLQVPSIRSKDLPEADNNLDFEYSYQQPAECQLYARGTVRASSRN
jgi:hypothetical protein